MEMSYQTIILFLLIFGFIIFVLPNLFYSRRTMPEAYLPTPLPLISILVPARNEEANIGRLLETALLETYPHFEVLVLDDHSGDRTGEIVQSYAQRDGRVKLIRGLPLPQRWGGKSFACHQLAETARGEYLFFTDADVTFRPGILEFSLKQATQSKAGLVSGFPRLWSPSFWGRLIMSNVYFLFFGVTPVPLLNTVNHPLFAYASGAYLFFKRDTYWKIGGHASIKGELTEDMALARRVKEEGLQLQFSDPSLFMDSKMYDNFGEVWDGYTKNLFKALGSNYGVLGIFLAGFFLLYLLRVYFLLGRSSPEAYPVVLVQVGLILLYRLVLSIRYRLGWESVLLHPLSIFFLLLIGLRSGLLSLTKKGYQWKGRQHS